MSEAGGFDGFVTTRCVRVLRSLRGAAVYLTVVLTLLVSMVSMLCLSDAQTPLGADYLLKVEDARGILGRDTTESITRFAEDNDVVVGRHEPSPHAPITETVNYLAGSDHETTKLLSTGLAPFLHSDSVAFSEATELPRSGEYFMVGNADHAESLRTLLSESFPNGSVSLTDVGIPQRVFDIVSHPVFVVVLVTIITSCVVVTVVDVLVRRRSIAAMVLMGHSRRSILASYATRKAVHAGCALMCGIACLMIALIIMGAQSTWFLTGILTAVVTLVLAIAIGLSLLAHAVLLRFKPLGVLKGRALPDSTGAVAWTTLVVTFVAALASMVSLGDGLQQGMKAWHAREYWQVLPSLTQLSGIRVDDGETPDEFRSRRQAIGSWARSASDAGDLIVVETAQTDHDPALTAAHVPPAIIVSVNTTYLQHYKVHTTTGRLTPSVVADGPLVVLPESLKPFEQVVKQSLHDAYSGRLADGVDSPPLRIEYAPVGHQVFTASNGSGLSAGGNLVRDAIIFVYPSDSTAHLAPLTYPNWIGSGASFVANPGLANKAFDGYSISSHVGAYENIAAIAASNYRLAWLSVALAVVQSVLLSGSFVLLTGILAWTFVQKRARFFFVQRLGGRPWYAILKGALLVEGVVALALFFAGEAFISMSFTSTGVEFNTLRIVLAMLTVTALTVAISMTFILAQRVFRSTVKELT